MPEDKNNKLQVINNTLTQLIKDKISAMPKDFNQTRFIQNCMSVLQDTKDIESVEPRSIARCMIKGAFLGLDFFNKECYPIPYNKKVGKEWIKELNFQTDYKGEKKIVKKYSINPVSDIYAKLVRKDDKFEEYVKDGKQTINFEPNSFSDKDVIGTFAVVLFADGSMMYETMSVKEIGEVKTGYAKTDANGKFSKAWENSYGEMCKKTVLRRLCKHIEVEFDSIEQKKTWDESSEMEVKDKRTKQVAASSLDGPVVEAEVVEVEKGVISEDSLVEEQEAPIDEGKSTYSCG